MKLRSRQLAVVVGALALVAAACVPSKPKPPLPPPPPGTEIEIDRAPDGDQVGRQDVYFLDEDAVLRNPDGETPGDAPLFTVAGVPLDLTWAEYQAVEVRKSVAVTVRGDEPHTLFFVVLEGLVPNGVYSVFHTTFGPDSEHPLCPNVLRELPVTTVLPTRPPDASSFVADGSGAVRYVGRVEGTPMDATQLSLQVIYHANGETYHPLPNRGTFETQGEACRSTYGVDAMRQVFILQKWLF